MVVGALNAEGDLRRYDPRTVTYPARTSKKPSTATQHERRNQTSREPHR